MPIRTLLAAFGSIFLVGCYSFAKPFEIALPGENGPNLKYREKLVKVCGLATKQFENVQITEHRDGNWRGNTRGLGVRWLDGEPCTEAPEERCVTGFLEPSCGWETFDNHEEDYDDLICLSTGHGFQWRINQVTKARD